MEGSVRSNLEDGSEHGESSSDHSEVLSEEEYFAVEDDGAGPAVVVRGAEPYRFEPMAPAQETPTAEGARGAGPVHSADERTVNTDWCTCGNCCIMADAVNCKCCREVDVGEVQCITEHPWFEATCLNPGTLQTAYYGYRQQYGARAVEGGRDRKFRHVAYRQVVRWCYGYLGGHNRVALPSCVMKKIMDTYPEPDGNYRGFQYPPLDEL